MGMATWDGTNWCGLGGVLEMPVQSFDFYHDTLYVGPLSHAEGLEVNCAAKYVGNYPDTCSAFSTTVSELASAPEFSLAVSGRSILVRFPSTTSATTVVLFDAVGRLLDTQKGREMRFDLHAASSGCYIVQAEGFAPRRVLIE